LHETTQEGQTLANQVRIDYAHNSVS